VNADTFGRFVPEAAVRNRSKQPLFDHLVGAGDQRRWDFQPERFGRLEVDHQLVPGRRLQRKVSGFFTLQDAVDI
jgi:hypothetical protein